MKSIRHIALGGVIAAIYAAVTILLAPISFGLIQFRIAEALCLFPALMPAAVPGLFLGCLLSALITGAPVYDVVFGSLATLLGALLTRFLAQKNAPAWTLPLPPVILNGVIIGLILRYVYSISAALPLIMLSVAAGEAVVIYVLGLPLYCWIRKKKPELVS